MKRIGKKTSDVPYEGKKMKKMTFSESEWARYNHYSGHALRPKPLETVPFQIIQVEVDSSEDGEKSTKTRTSGQDIRKRNDEVSSISHVLPKRKRSAESVNLQPVKKTGNPSLDSPKKSVKGMQSRNKSSKSSATKESFPFTAYKSIGFDKGTEFGCSDLKVHTSGSLVWAKFGRSFWWPGMVIDESLVNIKGLKTLNEGQEWVFWFGDRKISKVSTNSVEPLTSNFHARIKQKTSSLFKKAVTETLQVCAERNGVDEKIQKHDSDLLAWADQTVSKMSGNAKELLKKIVYPQQDGESVPTFVLKHLQQLRERSLSTEDDSEDESVDLSGKSEDLCSRLREVKARSLQIEEFCVTCGSAEKLLPSGHPLFKGGLCKDCKEMLLESLMATGEDGCSVFCMVCGDGGKLLVCDNLDCCRAYCVDCIEHFVSETSLKQMKNMMPWQCFLCTPYDIRSHGLLKPLKDWQLQIIRFFDTGFRIKDSDLSYFSSGERRPLRVLSLFDGIGTGLLALQELGLLVETYYAAEVDEDAILITRYHFGDKVLPLGDVTKIGVDKIEKICPVDLVIAGPPCNDLSIVNPANKGFNGTGSLFIDFLRILLQVMRLSMNRHVFWMMENTAAMKREYKEIICSNLEQKPALWDAKYFSAQKRARYFWGNIPGLYSTPAVSAELRKPTSLSSMLSPRCNRKARVETLRTVTTRSNSLMQGKDDIFPVTMDGKEDIVWVTELERGENFKPEFREISVLRSFTDCPWIALTATATSKVKEDIFKYLLFDPSRTITIAVLPDRPNIFLDIVEASADCEEELEWFLHHIKETRLSAKKTIIYCRTYSAVFNVWSWLVEEMGDQVYTGEKSAKTRLIEMYHSSTDKETQDRIIKEF